MGSARKAMLSGTGTGVHDIVQADGSTSAFDRVAKATLAHAAHAEPRLSVVDGSAVRGDGASECHQGAK